MTTAGGLAPVAKTVGVVGSGQMGTGIAQVALQAGCSVVLHDSQERALERACDAVRKGLLKWAQKGGLGEGRADEAFRRLTSAPSLTQLSSAEFIIEAVTEAESPKLDLFRSLDRLCPPGVIFASNTSSISITKLGSATRRPREVIGMHFMNPPPLMKLVEIVPGLQTAEETYRTTRALAEAMGKDTIRADESPGFIVNRILLPMINEAIYALQERLATPEDIDKAMKLGTNQPMGPLALADLIGLDTCLAILEVMHHEIGDPKYRPCPLLRKYVDAGYHGRKAGKGFYTYG